MSQHPNASPSPLAGELAAVIAEVVTAQANTMHAVARLAQLTRDLVEGTALQSGDAALLQEIAGLTAGPAPRPVHRTLSEEQAQRREAVLDFYATTDLSIYAIARRVGVDGSTPSKILRKARAAGDRRAAQGDLRRQQPLDEQATPSPDSPSAPHDGLPVQVGNASPEWPVESGVLGKAPAQGEEVVPAPDRGGELTTSDDPRPAPEPQIFAVDLAKVVGVSSGTVPQDEIASVFKMQASSEGRSAIEALRAANERIRQRPTEMELADELDPEPPPRRAEPEARRGPAGLAQRVASRVERPQEPAKPATKAVALTEAEVGLPILHVDRKAKTVVGPMGTWGGCTDIVLSVMGRLADGNLYGQPVLQKLAGFNRPETFDTILKRWKEELQAIGVEMFVGPAGVRLQRQEIV